MDGERMTAKRMRNKAEALDELNREFNIRSRCFSRWIDDGRLSKTDAQDRLDRLATAIEIVANADSEAVTSTGDMT